MTLVLVIIFGFIDVCGLGDSICLRVILTRTIGYWTTWDIFIMLLIGSLRVITVLDIRWIVGLRNESRMSFRHIFKVMLLNLFDLKSSLIFLLEDLIFNPMAFIIVFLLESLYFL